MYDFKFHNPDSLAAALESCSQAEDGQFMAGGQTMIPVMKQRLSMPSDVIDLGSVEDLKGISVADGVVSIGAMTTHALVAADGDVQRAIPVLAALAGGIGDPHVRNRGTLGGSIANNDPAADYPAALVALGANVHTDRREIAADDFFTGMFETSLEEGELVVRVDFPVPKAAGYAKFGNPASRYAMVGVFVSQGSDGVRVAVTGAAPCVFRISEMEKALSGDFSPAAIKDMTVPAADLNNDIHASAEYRAHLIGVMAARAVGDAILREGAA